MANNNTRAPVVMADMDFTLYDHELHVFQYMETNYGHRGWVMHPDLTNNYSLSYQYGDLFGKEVQEIVDAFQQSERFYIDMPLMSGAREAVFEMTEEGIYVKIISAPSTVNLTSPEQKKESIRIQFDEYSDIKWSEERFSMPEDRCVEFADIHIDDHSALVTTELTEWERIYFAQNHNQGMFPRLEHWSQWRELIYPMLHAKGFEMIDGRWGKVIANVPQGLILPREQPSLDQAVLWTP